MRIKHLALTDYRVFESAEITFDQPLSIIRGPSHAGKSSIGRAIKLGLTKCAIGTDPRGAGANDCIRLGGKKAIMEMTIEGSRGPLILRVAYGPNMQGRSQSINGCDPALAEQFAKYMDLNQDRLSCCLDSSFFPNPKTDSRSIIAGLVIPTSYNWDPALVEKVERYLGKQAWDSNPVALIDFLYGGPGKGLYGQRTAVKAALNAIHIPTKPTKPEHADPAQIQEHLYQLRKKAATEAGKIKRSGTVQIGRLEQMVEQHEAELARAEQAFTQAEQDLKAKEKLLLSPPTIKKHEKVAANRAKFDAIQKRLEVNSKKIEEYVEAQEIYREMLAEGVCERCTQPIGKDFVDGKIEEFQRLIDAASEQQRSLLEEQKPLGDIAGAEAALAAERTNGVLRDGAKKAIEAATEKTRSLETALADSKTALAAAKAAEAEPIDTSALDQVNAEIQAWEATLGPAVQYETTLKTIETATAHRTEEQRKVTELESLCTYFGKDGIKADLLGQHAGAFMDTVNGVLDTWGYAAELDIDAGTFLINGLPVKELAGSEETFFKVALQSAIAVQSGIRMIVVDPLDEMDEQERGKAFGIVKSMLDQGQLDQAIMIGHDLRRDPIALDGVGVYYVDDGTIERL